MKLRQMILGAFSCAIIFIITAFIALPLGNIGYINLGDTMIMLSASLLPPSIAFLVAALGSCFADLYLGFPQYMIFTFFIKGVEALIISKMLYHHETKRPWIFILGGLIVVIGYALTDMILTQNVYTGLLSIGLNGIQATCSVVLAMLLYQPFQVFIKKKTSNM